MQAVRELTGVVIGGWARAPDLLVGRRRPALCSAGAFGDVLGQLTDVVLVDHDWSCGDGLLGAEDALVAVVEPEAFDSM